jgi:DNA topoisomerase IB
MPGSYPEVTVAEAKKSARLRRSDCAEPGIARRRRGRGFTYLGPDGGRIEDEATLERIGSLAIPPAWKDVWICTDPLGHVQATGVDAAGRKQYLYHERWQRRAAQRKFAAMREFAAALPRLRRAVKRDLALEGVPRERALACAVRLIDLGLFRVGGEEYAEENGSFGVATIRREHVRLDGGELVFDFPAKSGQHRVQSLRDAGALRAIEAMRRRRCGPDDLLVYRDRGAWHDVRSADVNDYIQEQIGEAFSAKDFRTWHGTVLAAIELASGTKPTSRGGTERAIKAAVERVAAALGNTPAVCRDSYVDPRVFDRFREGVTIEPPPATNGRVGQRARARVERAVLELIS